MKRRRKGFQPGNRAALTHALFESSEALPTPDNPAVLALCDRMALAERMESLYSMCLHIGGQFSHAETLTPADVMSVYYIDLASQCEQSRQAIESGSFNRWTMRRILSVESRAKAFERQSVIVAYMMSKTARAFQWFQSHGFFRPDGVTPQSALSYFGVYVGRTKRNIETLAGLLIEREGEAQDLSLALSKIVEEAKHGPPTDPR